MVSQDSPRLLDRMRAEIRLSHYSLRTGSTIGFVDDARQLSV